MGLGCVTVCGLYLAGCGGNESYSLCSIVNSSIDTGTFPHILKQATIIEGWKPEVVYVKFRVTGIATV